MLEINMFVPCDSCSEADEIYKICGVMGNPTTESWADGLKLARDINYQFPQVKILYIECYFLN
jgi:hypothetical protein